MARGGKKKSSESAIPKPKIKGKGIGKNNGNVKKHEALARGVEILSSAASGSGAPNTGISESNDEFAGYIFLCNGRTKPECFRYRVFGLPALRIDVVAKIQQNTKLFLFDTDVKLLYGVYSATSTGTMNLEPHAFGGRFPAQVRFEIFKECMPIPESIIRDAIKDNYQGRFKFRQDLSADQVDNLISLFRPLSSPLPAPRTSLESYELQSREILLHEIEKQRQSPGILTPARLQVGGSQYIGSRFVHSSYQGPPVSQLLYDSERHLTSIDWPYDRRREPFQHLPLSMLSPHNTFHPEYPRQPEYSTFIPNPLDLSSRYSREQLLSGIQVNPHMVLPHDYHLYQSRDHRQSHGPTQVPPQISVTSRESDRAPSSVLAAAYWVAVANEIPRPCVHQTSDSAHNPTGQNSGTLEYKPPNLTSESILDAYWEAKALEDSRQAHPGPSHMLGSNAPSIAESTYEPSQPLTAPYWVSVASEDQNHALHSNQQPIPTASQGSTFPISHTANTVGNDVASFPPEPQQPVPYDPVKFHMQHGLPSYRNPYSL